MKQPDLDRSAATLARAEERRLREDARRARNWKRWGPYLAERQWGTVREDYSHDGSAWDYFPHEHARSRAYRWGEDGLLGICDRQARVCFALALWNGADPILKERCFGLTGPQGNHGEDVKECYYYLDSTPTHSYMRALYKYPQRAYPYEELLAAAARRGRDEGELELADTGAFDEDRYFDVQVEYAKAGPDDVLVRITVSNRGPQPADLEILPTLWFRNTWSWGGEDGDAVERPRLWADGPSTIAGRHADLGALRLLAGAGPSGEAPQLVFTENESNVARLWGATNASPWVKDAFHELVVHGRAEAVNPQRQGSKAAARYRLHVAAGGSVELRLRLLCAADEPLDALGGGFERVFQARRAEADGFYAARIPAALTQEQRAVARQAYAGLLWSKQFYHYVVPHWLRGDPAQPSPPTQRAQGRNHQWPHVYNRDVISMPDKWEYPWYAAWDLAFHMIPFARIDPDFAKGQLELLLREWYMHPNGQIPAYEWAFSDVNPPVHAWACWRVYKKTGPAGARDRRFLASCFQKLLLNFTWWVNRKDSSGRHLFAGGFLGMDNISVFDRSQPLPDGATLDQADGTAWMAFYCGTMLSMALELAREEPLYEDMASKFFEHYVAIADAMNNLGGSGLWSEEDGFYYDKLQRDGAHQTLRVRSMVGLIPLLAVEVLEDDLLERLPGFSRRMRWFLEHRRDLAAKIGYLEQRSVDGERHRLLAIPSRERLERILQRLFDEGEFLAPHGVRSLSKVHAREPFVLELEGRQQRVEYAPGESNTALFGGNSNWRGPIWFPINFLVIEALERYHHFWGDSLQVELPRGSGRRLTLQQAADELSGRLTSLFVPGADGSRPCHGGDARYQRDPHWRDLVLFHEYFHGEDGKGLGASHQTGWTALAASLLDSMGRRSTRAQRTAPPAPDLVAAETR